MGSLVATKLSTKTYSHILSQPESRELFNGNRLHASLQQWEQAV